MKRIMILIGLSLLMFLLTSCNVEEAKLKEPPVTEPEAEEIAKEDYHIKLINKFGLIELEEDEINKSPLEDAENLTSLYYVIEGITEDEEATTLYINSDDKTLHYTE